MVMSPNDEDLAHLCLRAASSASVLRVSVVIGIVTTGGIGTVVGTDTTAIPVAAT